jgi:hypothetical protein
MGLFARRPSKPDALDEESLTGMGLIRRTKVTVDRYWVAKAVAGGEPGAAPERAGHEMEETREGKKTEEEQ